MAPFQAISSWAAPKLQEHNKVTAVHVLSDCHLHLERRELPDVTVGLTSVERLDEQALSTVLARDTRIGFVANVPKESFVAGSALVKAASVGVGVGKYADLLRALSEPDVRTFVNNETRFVMRMLDQHTSVSGYERLDDRRYLIRRHGLSDLVAVFLYEYDLTADAVRTARARYGEFQADEKANPNGGITSEAKTAAGSMRAAVLDWRQFLGRLNSP